jgi:WD40 repeat protein
LQSIFKKGSFCMKTTFTIVILFTLLSLNTFAQDSPQWHLPDGAKAHLGKGTIHEIKTSPDGTRIAVAGGIGIWIYDTATRQEVALLPGHTSGVNSVAFSPGGRTIVSGSWENTIRLWDADTSEYLRTLSGTGQQVTSIAFSPDGATLASGSEDGTVRLWDFTPSTPDEVVVEPLAKIGKRLTFLITLKASQA